MPYRSPALRSLFAGSTRTRLRVVAIASAGTTLLCVSALMWSPFGARVAMPGPLGSQHATLRERCEACHVEALDAVQDVRHGLVSTEIDLRQSALCGECHDLGPRPLAAHGWLEEELVVGRRGAPLSSAPPRIPTGPAGETACSVCHREHRGRHALLAELDDGRCQVCHGLRFTSFEEAHPAFEGYPYERRTRIVFDHVSHVRRHFLDEEVEDAPTACTDCHEVGASGEHMPVKDYERACSACHDEEIRGSDRVDGPGLAFLALPALDTITLEERGAAIGRWPADSAVSEEPIPPFLAFLLSTDARTETDLTTLRGLDLLDLSEADDEEIEAVVRVAWDIKSLLEEISIGGHPALLERLTRATAGTISPYEADALLASIPEDLLRRALGAWVPELAEELDGWRAAQPLPTDGEPDDGVGLDLDRDRQSWVASGGWYLQGLDCTIRYRPGGHADPFLRAWIELAAGIGEAPGREAAERVLVHLSTDTPVGACTKCHSVDRDGEGLVVNWRGGLDEAEDDPLTFFSHRAHFPSAAKNVCLECHELGPGDPAYLESYAQPDPTLSSSSFAPMPIARCTECHGARGAAQDCLSCHRYHARSAGTETPVAPLDAALPTSR